MHSSQQPDQERGSQLIKTNNHLSQARPKDGKGVLETYMVPISRKSFMTPRAPWGMNTWLS